MDSTSTVSNTAMGVSLMRAIHTRKALLPIIDDPWGDTLVPEDVIERLQQMILSFMPQDMVAEENYDALTFYENHIKNKSIYSNVVMRARFTENALLQAIKKGVKQYVIIGAGFDSFALRKPREAHGLTVFEIDHPATQQFKQQRFAVCGLAMPDNCYWLAADLAEESLEAVLSRSVYNPLEPAFFSWLGVTFYLTPEDNMKTLRTIAHCSAPGSECVFNYLDQKVFSAAYLQTHTEHQQIKTLVAQLGEPFLSGFHPAELPGLLTQCGLSLVEDSDDTKRLQRYDPHNKNQWQAADRNRIAHVKKDGE